MQKCLLILICNIFKILLVIFHMICFGGSPTSAFHYRKLGVLHTHLSVAAFYHPLIHRKLHNSPESHKVTEIVTHLPPEGAAYRPVDSTSSYSGSCHK